mmetsp:Transcript_9293/g.26432  ORF Transcript_9293/g.26432 Transcript_9293/m.26432 type:complete len:204 (-) Transcript_9293:301-912(-)
MKSLLQKHLPEQHTIGHVFDHGIFGCAILETDRVSNFFPEPAAKLLRNSFCDTHCSNTPWLGAANFPSACVARLGQVLRHLSRLSGSCFSYHNHELVVIHRLNQLIPEFVNRKPFPLFCYGQRAPLSVRSGLTESFLLPLWDVPCRQARAFHFCCELPVSRGHGIFPRPREVLWDGLHLASLLLLLQFPSFLGQGRLGHGCSL